MRSVRRRRAARSADLAVLLVIAAPPAAADVPGLALSWQAPEGCPTAQQVEQAVLAGRLDRESAPGRQVFAEVRVERRDDGAFVAKLSTRAPEGRGLRLLEGESCDAIASASAVVLALALDQQAPPALPQPKATATPSPTPLAKRPPSPWLGYVHVFGGGVLRALPEPSPLIGVGAGVRRGAWDAELLIALASPQTAHLGAPPGARADISLLSVQALGCLSPVSSATTALELCGGALYERLSGESQGVSNGASSGVGIVSAELGLRSRLRLLPGLDIAFDVVGIARPLQPHFLIGGIGQVHEMPTFDGMFTTGLMYGF